MSNKRNASIKTPNAYPVFVMTDGWVVVIDEGQCVPRGTSAVVVCFACLFIQKQIRTGSKRKAAQEALFVSSFAAGVRCLFWALAAFGVVCCLLCVCGNKNKTNSTAHLTCVCVCLFAVTPFFWRATRTHIQ